MNSSTLANIRVTVFAMAGLVTAAYAIGVLISGRPDPMLFWIPGVAGICAAIAIFMSAGAAGQSTRDQAFDEGYLADTHKAQRYGFWIALFLYPAFGLLMFLEVVNHEISFAAMGTLTGASFLFLFVWFDLRGRQ